MATIETIPLTIPDQSPGTLIVQRWSPSERTSRAFRKSAKIGGLALAISSMALVVHILLLIMVPALVITLFALIPIFLKIQSEKATFVSAEGVCPFCKVHSIFRPFLKSELKPQITLQCINCGQTSSAFVDTAHVTA